MLQLLNNDAIKAEIEKLDDWIFDNHSLCICKEWKFDSFRTAVNFFVAVGELAEINNHHPEFISNYSKMKISLTTHDVCGLTHKDFDLAMKIDQLVRNDFSKYLKSD